MQILMGDEVRRTQRGNNNAYCQDNQLSWFDWSLLSKHAHVRRFVRLLLSRRVTRRMEQERRRSSLNEWLREATWRWHGVKTGKPGWSRDSPSLAFSAELPEEGLRFYWILNAYWEPLDFEVPAATEPWRRWIDTALDSPHDIIEWQAAPLFPGRTNHAAKRSVVALVGGPRFEGQHDL
jgi:glycogen operon protein